MNASIDTKRKTARVPQLRDSEPNLRRNVHEALGTEANNDDDSGRARRKRIKLKMDEVSRRRRLNTVAALNESLEVAAQCDAVVRMGRVEGQTSETSERPASSAAISLQCLEDLMSTVKDTERYFEAKKKAPHLVALESNPVHFVKHADG